jgi:hypothetical protein
VVLSAIHSLAWAVKVQRSRMTRYSFFIEINGLG